MEYESDGEIKERAYRMHEMGGANWRIAQILGESESTIEKWIYDEDRDRGREEYEKKKQEETGTPEPR